MPAASVPINLAYNELRVEAGQTDVPGLQESVMLQIVDKAYKEYRRHYRRHGTEQSFRIKSEGGATLVASAVLGEDITTSTTDFDVDDGTLLGDVAGAGAIWKSDTPDIFEYSAPSGNNIPSVTGLTFSHSTNAQVQKFYPVPSDFHSLRAEERSPDGMMLDGNYPLVFTSSPPTTSREFSIYDNGSNKWFWFNRGLTGTIRYTYNKIGTTIDSTDDDLDLADDDHVFFFMYRLIAHGKRARGDNIRKISLPNSRTIDEDDHTAELMLRQIHKERNIGRFTRVRQFRPFQLSDVYSDRSLRVNE